MGLPVDVLWLCEEHLAAEDERPAKRGFGGPGIGADRGEATVERAAGYPTPSGDRRAVAKAEAPKRFLLGEAIPLLILPAQFARSALQNIDRR